MTHYKKTAGYKRGGHRSKYPEGCCGGSDIWPNPSEIGAMARDLFAKHPNWSTVRLQVRARIEAMKGKKS